jgi:hypothetical protein
VRCQTCYRRLTELSNTCFPLVQNAFRVFERTSVVLDSAAAAGLKPIVCQTEMLQGFETCQQEEFAAPNGIERSSGIEPEN